MQEGAVDSIGAFRSQRIYYPIYYYQANYLIYNYQAKVALPCYHSSHYKSNHSELRLFAGLFNRGAGCQWAPFLLPRSHRDRTMNKN